MSPRKLGNQVPEPATRCRAGGRKFDLASAAWRHRHRCGFFRRAISVEPGRFHRSESMKSDDELLLKLRDDLAAFSASAMKLQRVETRDFPLVDLEFYEDVARRMSPG